MDVYHYIAAGAVGGILLNGGLKFRIPRFSDLTGSMEFECMEEKISHGKMGRLSKFTD